MVLNVTEYVNQHPGGKFVLKINVGRDISKFFYGGYCLEDNLGPAPARGYNHSNYAKLICDSLVVATYKPDSQTSSQTVTCYVDKSKTHKWNATTATVCFQNVLNEPVPCFQNSYKSLDTIGKHFKLRSLKNLDLYRQYTVCSTMQPRVYNGLLE